MSQAGAGGGGDATLKEHRVVGGGVNVFFVVLSLPPFGV